jgi:acetylornithine deacetylase/succinyl-diaminopimelate desuccinylase-like protein
LLEWRFCDLIGLVRKYLHIEGASNVWYRDHRPGDGDVRLESLLEQLVACRSYSGEEEPIAELVSDIAERWSYEVASPYRRNVTVSVPGIRHDRTLILTGHLDTVPGEWPGALTLRRESGRLIGLGASDMKAGLAVMLALIEHYHGNPPPCDLYFVFSCEEETTGAGAQYVVPVIRPQLSGHVETILLEPTGNSFVGFGHRGQGTYILTARGLIQHAAFGTREDAALPRMASVVSDLYRQAAIWSAQYPDPEYGPISVNVTRMAGAGDAANVLPGSAQLFVDVRMNRPFAAVANQEMGAFAAGRHLEISYPAHPIRIVETPADTWLFLAFETAWPLPREPFPGASDLGDFLELGPAVIFGPGDPRAMHVPGESVAIGAMESCLATLLRVVAAYAALP